MSKFYVIVGLGETGLSCVRFCIKRHLNFAVTDSREHPPGQSVLQKIAPNIQTAFGEFSKDLIEKADTLIVSPGVSLKDSIFSNTHEKIIGDIELFALDVNAPVVAITGSNAKSTVTALVGEIAKQAEIRVKIGGNIGTPALDLLDDSVELYVLELSSFQLETTRSLAPKVATVLNVSEDHMDRYDSLEDYIAAKKIIYRRAQMAVINLSDSRVWPDKEIPTIGFSLSSPKENNFGLIDNNLMMGSAALMPAGEMALCGQHNIENALAALAISKALLIDMGIAVKVLKTFKGLPHRCQLVREREGVRWYNDSKGTNVGATIAALDGLGKNKNIILIAGGQGKGADFSPLQAPLKKHVKQLILIGEDADKIDKNNMAPHHEAGNLKEAVMLAKQFSVEGDIVLLSPACASFDMFKNYEQRGHEFETLVNHL